MLHIAANETGKIEFIDTLNHARKSNKDKWVFIVGYIGDTQFAYKAFNTWVQRLSINGIVFDTVADCSVKVFLESLGQAFDYSTALQN